jgi:hypothetical protein
VFGCEINFLDRLYGTLAKKIFRISSLLTKILYRPLYTVYNNCERSTTMPRYKTAAQLVLLLSAIAMILLGIRLGEAETVLSKAIRLCMECVGIG